MQFSGINSPKKYAYDFCNWDVGFREITSKTKQMMYVIFSGWSVRTWWMARADYMIPVMLWGEELI